MSCTGRRASRTRRATTHRGRRSEEGTQTGIDHRGRSSDEGAREPAEGQSWKHVLPVTWSDNKKRKSSISTPDPQAFGDGGGLHARATAPGASDRCVLHAAAVPGELLRGGDRCTDQQRRSGRASSSVVAPRRDGARAAAAPPAGPPDPMR